MSVKDDTDAMINKLKSNQFDLIVALTKHKIDKYKQFISLLFIVLLE